MPRKHATHYKKAAAAKAYVLYLRRQRRIARRTPAKHRPATAGA